MPFVLVFNFFCILLFVQNANGLGLQAVTDNDYCQVIINFPSDTVPKWVCFCFKNLMGLLFLF